MNYSPKDYKSILNHMEEIDSNASDIEYVKFDTDVEDAQDYVASLEKEINKSANKIRSLTNDSISEVHGLIYSDFINSQERYIELVNVGYEEDLFPFAEWLGITNDLKWLTYSNTNICREFSNLEEEKEIKVQLMRNIEYLWLCVERTVVNENDKRRLFSDCLKLTENLPIEHKEPFIERFIFSNSIEDNFINFLESKEDLDPYTLNFNKSAYYIDYLFRKCEVNDEKLHEVFSLIQKNKTDLLLNQIADVLIVQGSNSFLTFHDYKLHQVNTNNIEKLFEFDRDYDLGLSQCVLKNFKNLQTKLYFNDQVKLDNICLFLERGCASIELSNKIPQKEEVVRLRKI